MNLRINDPGIEELAQELAKQTGEPLDEAVRRALQERLAREAEKAERHERPKALVGELNTMPVAQARRKPLSEEEIEAKKAAIMEVVRQFNELPVLDDRPANEIIGYNEFGHFD